MKASNRPTRRIFLNYVRHFNKHILNRIVLWLAYKGIGPYSIVTHKGRRSGRIYKTPVLASHVQDQIYIPLPYGDQVDWLRNVIAQSGCMVFYEGEETTALDPEVIEAEVALSFLPEGRRNLLDRPEVEKFLRLTRSEE